MGGRKRRNRHAGDIQTRVDGAASSGQPSRRRKRTTHSPNKDAIQTSLDATVASKLFWDFAHNIQPEPARRGRPCETTPAAIILVDITAAFTGSIRSAISYLADNQTWKRLTATSRQAWPNDNTRRLPERPPSRNQHIRFRNRHLTHTSTQVDQVQGIARDIAITLLHTLDMFNQKAGSFTNPDQTQLLTGDATFIKSIYNTNDKKLIDPHTGEIFHRRTDLDADWTNNTKGNAPNYNLVDVVAQNTHPGERIIIDATLRKKGSGIGDGEVFCDLVNTIHDELRKLNRDIYAAAYDMALDATDYDRLLRQGISPISKVPLTKAGKTHEHNLGNCTFTQTDKTKTTLKVVAIGGTPTIQLPGIDGPITVKLERKQTKRVARKRGYQISSVFQIPELPEVPVDLQNAETRIHHHTTDRELNNSKLSPRTRNLRVFPPTDPTFDRLFGCRETTESMHHHFKTTLVNRRARTVGALRLHHTFHTYQMSVNITTALRYAKRTDDWSMFGNWRPDSHSPALAA